MELPFCKFYPRDYLTNMRLRSVSLGARGLWADMLSLMHLSSRRGYLEVAGKPLQEPKDIARYIAADSSEVAPLLAELEQAGVFSRDERGVIFSRRIVKDVNLHEIRSAAGSQGGQKRLLNQKLKQDVEQNGKQTVDSGTLDSGNGNLDNLDSEVLPPTLDSPQFKSTWRDWIQHRRQKKKPLTPKAREANLAKLAEWGPDRAVAAIRHSLENGWTGLFEPKSNPKPNTSTKPLTQFETGPVDLTKI